MCRYPTSNPSRDFLHIPKFHWTGRHLWLYFADNQILGDCRDRKRSRARISSNIYESGHLSLLILYDDLLFWQKKTSRAASHFCDPQRVKRAWDRTELNAGNWISIFKSCLPVQRLNKEWPRQQQELWPIVEYQSWWFKLRKGLSVQRLKLQLRKFTR